VPTLTEHLESLAPALDVHGAWACFANPKTASKSIGEVLDHRQILRHRGPRNWQRFWDEVYAPRIDEVLLFTFVRNPWDKVVSTFHFLQQNKEIGPYWSFRDYVKQVLKKDGHSVNRHFNPQIDTVAYRRRPIPLMYVGRFENLHEDWARIARMLGESEELPVKNQSRHDRYETYYDDESRDIVASIYSREIKFLKYRFGK